MCCRGLSNFYNFNYWCWYLAAGIESVRGCERAGKRVLSRSTCVGPINFPCIFIFWICWWQFAEYQNTRGYSGHATRSAVLAIISNAKVKSWIEGEIEADMIEEFRVGESQSSRVTQCSNWHQSARHWFESTRGSTVTAYLTEKKEEPVDAVARLSFFFLFLIWQIGITTTAKSPFNS